MSHHSLTKLYSLGFTTALILVALALSIFWRVTPRPDTVTIGIKTTVPESIEGRTVVDFSYQGNGVVAYSYLDKPVPAKITDTELPELRNETSYTQVLEPPQKGVSNGVLQTIFYTQPTFTKDADGTWRYIEHAITTEQAFRNRDMTLWNALSELVVRSAYAASISPYSGAGDGVVQGSATDSDGCASQWSLVTGTIASSTGTTMKIYTSDRVALSCTANRDRVFIPFDTSAITAGSSITAVTLSVWPTVKVNNDNDTIDYLTVVSTSQADHTTLASSDWGSVGAEGVDSGQRKDITSLTTGAYTTFTLNATGRGFVKTSGQSSSCSATTGITCLGIMEGHDFENSVPISNNAAGNSVTLSTSENTGTTQDPQLSVTYTPGSGFNWWQFSDF